MNPPPLDYQPRDLDKDSEALIGMMTTLMHDVIRCHEDLKASENSSTAEDQHFFRRRAYARAVFAAIEGSCECFRKQAFVAESNKVPSHISLAKLSVLAGETYYVTNEGDIRAQPLRLRFLDHMLLSLKSYAEAQGMKYRTQKGDQCHRIQKAVAVRHRITHPKTLSGLALTKEEVADIEFSLGWFLNEITCVLREIGFEFSALVLTKPV